MKEKQRNTELLLLKGNPLKNQILENIKTVINKIFLNNTSLEAPTLAIILVGDNASSLVYVQQKIKTAESIGIKVEYKYFPADTDINILQSQIEFFNHKKNIHGIILQLPLPSNINEFKLIESIDPTKDVDGMHPLNLGKLLIGESPFFYSATPLGIIKLLQFYNIETQGKNITIINRSNIVGKPLFFLLSSKHTFGNATVTLCHTYTKNLAEYTTHADIIISATSKKYFIEASLVKENSVLIDLGQHVENIKNIRYLYGDFDPSVYTKSRAITPVPGGVGPMTVAILMENTLKSFLFHNNLLENNFYDFF